jgi:N-acetylglutamate synthase-like GNAT family acetyltransferase
VISASGKTEESLLIQIDDTASVVQRSRARMSSNKRKKTFILTELEILKTAGLNGLERKTVTIILCVALLSNCKGKLSPSLKNYL